MSYGNSHLLEHDGNGQASVKCNWSVQELATNNFLQSLDKQVMSKN